MSVLILQKSSQCFKVEEGYPNDRNNVILSTDKRSTVLLVPFSLHLPF
jgi:hypothetical protein